MPRVIAQSGEKVIEIWPSDDPLLGFPDAIMRRAWGAGDPRLAQADDGGRWVRAGVAGRLPDPWLRAAAANGPRGEATHG
jgi:hypothetical protein